jgi:hypothetical protein
MVDSLEIDPFNSNRMLYGTGATMYGTNNLTAWDSGGTVDISVAAVGIEETAVQDLISPPAGTAHLVSAVADVGGFTHNDLTKPSVMDASPVFTSGSSLDYAELSPGFIVRAGTGGSNGVNIAFSPDGGQNVDSCREPARRRIGRDCRCCRGWQPGLVEFRVGHLLFYG